MPATSTSSFRNCGPEGGTFACHNNECIGSTNDVVAVILFEVGLDLDNRQSVDRHAGGDGSVAASVTGRPSLLAPSPEMSITRRVAT